jgi:hypothetical protein
MKVFFVACIVSSQVLASFTYQADFSFRLSASPSTSYPVVFAQGAAFGCEVNAFIDLADSLGQFKAKRGITTGTSAALIASAAYDLAFSLVKLVVRSEAFLAATVQIVDQTSGHSRLAFSI